MLHSYNAKNAISLCILRFELCYTSVNVKYFFAIRSYFIFTPAQKRIKFARKCVYLYYGFEQRFDSEF